MRPSNELDKLNKLHEALGHLERRAFNRLTHAALIYA